ncbi:MAG: methyltransferase domain-containing protein [Acidimicrobiia bacterium]
MRGDSIVDLQAIDVSVLRHEIQHHYAEVAATPEADFHFHTGRRAAKQVGYDDRLLEGLPDGAVEAFAGVANPFHFGLPGSGEKVLDIGSGAGLDSVIAARAVGDAGEVVGVDMTPTMLDRARGTVDDCGVTNVEFRLGFAENLPVADGWADLVISNGVLNLVPDKVSAYREIVRVLRPGGRIQIADICVDKPVPEGAKRDIDLWTG